jgi:hypothetical protein
MSQDPAPAPAIDDAAPVAPIIDASAAPATGAATEAAPAGADTVTAAAATDIIRPEGLPDELWEDGKGVRVGDLWSAFKELKAQAEAKGDVPADAAGYDLAVPEGVTLPDGLTVEAMKADPFFAAAQAAALKHGIPKAAFNDLAAAYVQDAVNFHADQTKVQVEAYAAAKTALGENVDKRVEAAKGWLTANLSQAQTAAIMAAPFSAELIKGLETIIALRAGPTPGQGGGTNVAKFEGLRGEALLDAIRTKAA